MDKARETLVGQTIATIRCAEQLSAVELAKRELRSMPIPWHEVERAADDVIRSNPRIGGRRLVQLIVLATVQRWSTGTDCC
jgi:hypothetical protein